MKLFENIGNKLAKVTGKAGLRLQKHSPEILMAVGIVGIVGSGIMACRATLKIDEVMDKHQDAIARIKNGKEEQTEEVYSEKDYKRDLTVTYVHTAGNLVKLYAPAVITGAAGIACIIGGHKILHGRYVGVIAAYNVLDQGYREYRKRVADEFGIEKEEMLHHNLRKEYVTEIEDDENGKPVKKKHDTYVSNNPDSLSMYARFYDESSPQWIKDPIHNLAFIRGCQKMANDLLMSKGYIFLNDVYKMLGIDCCEPGQIVGWVLGGEDSDNKIDFGLDSPRNARFINGHERSALLDFNVDGVVHDVAFRKKRA